MRKPAPKAELVANLVSSVGIIRITTHSADARAFVEQNAPDFGRLYPENGYWTLFVSDGYAYQEVVDYLNSYNDAGRQALEGGGAE